MQIIIELKPAYTLRRLTLCDPRWYFDSSLFNSIYQDANRTKVRAF